MTFDYADTDPSRRRMRFGSRLVPLVIGPAVVVFGALAIRKYTAANRDDDPRRTSGSSATTMPGPP